MQLLVLFKIYLCSTTMKAGPIWGISGRARASKKINKVVLSDPKQNFKCRCSKSGVILKDALKNNVQFTRSGANFGELNTFSPVCFCPST